jgi:nitrate/nitrite transporter NarK
VFFGWLSDKVGRRPIMLTGIFLAMVAFFPAMHQLAKAANPDLIAAQTATPVTIVADPTECSVQFNPVGKTPDGRDAFATSCDVAKSLLTNSGISYDNVVAPAGSIAIIKIGSVALDSVDITKLDAKAQKTAKAAFGDKVKAALKAAGYPDKADPAKINHAMVLAFMMVFVVAATALYGPLAAALVEMFPTRIRYTALSVPYHLGTGIFGGFMPATAVAIVATTGNMYSGMWYTVGIAIIAFIIAIIFMPETRGRDIHSL